ncbi:MAG TPA: AsmA family protein [Patescibacteria group bacterium]|nr:AsmA family protein [Patescibacteria group bacterium]
MMKKIVAGLFFLSLFLLVVALIAPGFIDWSAHKDKIIAQLQPYVARKIDVGGKVSFRILPNPELVLEDVTIANPPGFKSPQFMTLKQLEARVKLGPLLQGRYEVETINLDSPVLNFETLSDGTGNWNGVLTSDAQLNAPADAIRLSQVSMTNGTVYYQHASAGTVVQIENLNLATTAETLAGPYVLKGDMVYRGTSVIIEGSTGKYVAGTPVALSLSFKPAADLPEVAYNGVADLSQSLALQGELNINGSLAAATDNVLLKNIEFLSDPADITGMLSLKAGEAAFTGFKGKVGKKGDIKGNVVFSFAPGKKPEVTADLDGSELRITGKPGVLEMPQDFTPHFKLKGRGITLGGAYLPGITATIDGTDKDWAVREARIDLPGKTKIKLSGVITPRTQYSAYSIQVVSDDAQKLVGNSAFSEGNVFKIIGASGLVQKVDLSGSLDVKQDSISLFDINGKMNGVTTVSGVINMRRGAKNLPDFDVILNLDKADATALFNDAYASLVGALMKSKAALTLNVKDFGKGDVSASDLALKAKINDGVLGIESMTGNIGSGSFALSGQVAGLNPLAGMDIDYSLKLASLGNLGAFGIEIPPPLWGSSPADVKGHIKGDAKQYTFSAEGGEIAISGTATAGNQGTYSYQNDVVLKNASWTGIGMPVDKLFSDGGSFSFKAKLNGTRNTYQFENIEAGAVTGTLGRREGKYIGDLTVPEADIDRWVWSDWKLAQPLALTLNAKKLTWRGTDIANAQLTVDAKPDEIKVSELKGEIWDGSITAEAAAHRSNGAWKGSVKASMRNADLQRLVTLLELKGFTLGQGDLDIDLAENSAAQDKNWFTGIDGDLTVNTPRLTVQNFSPRAAARFALEAKGTVPLDLPAEFADALRSEDTTYRNVEAALKLGDGKVTIGKLRLQDIDAASSINGYFDLQPENFRVSADVQLKNVPAFPSFTVTRMGPMEKAPPFTVDGTALGNWFVRNTTPEPLVMAPGEDALPLEENVADEGGNPEPGNTPEPPIDLQPAGPRIPAPEDVDATPPADDNGALINNTPIETEELNDATPPAETTPAGTTPPVDDKMKGLLDRLNALPPEPEQPEGLRDVQKPDSPVPATPAGDEKEEILD